MKFPYRIYACLSGRLKASCSQTKIISTFQFEYLLVCGEVGFGHFSCKDITCTDILEIRLDRKFKQVSPLGRKFILSGILNPVLSVDYKGI